jgi:hypothetical protein
MNIQTSGGASLSSDREGYRAESRNFGTARDASKTAAAGFHGISTHCGAGPADSNLSSDLAEPKV